MRPLLAALRFLTILPLPDPGEAALGRSLPGFPLVGLIVGAIAAGLDWLGFRLGCPGGLMGIVDVAVLAGLTGGLHLDSLADTADGFLSAKPRERVLEIMRDSRIGTMGALALILVLALKVEGLSGLKGPGRTSALLLAPLAGRCLQVITICLLPYARPEGGVAAVFESAKRPIHGIWAAACLAGASAIPFGLRGLGAAAACGAVLILTARWSKKRIGGYTGDTLGATGEVAETVILVYWSIMLKGGAT